jgi:hypothetical protein
MKSWPAVSSVKLALVGAVLSKTATLGAAAAESLVAEERQPDVERALLNLFDFNEEYSSLEGWEEQELTLDKFVRGALGSEGQEDDQHRRNLWDSVLQEDIQNALHTWMQVNYGGDFKAAFEAMDVNNSQALSRDEVIALASKIGDYEQDPVVATRLRNWFNEDITENSSLDLTEFRAAAKGGTFIKTNKPPHKRSI